jgi:hypothetical protein
VDSMFCLTCDHSSLTYISEVFKYPAQKPIPNIPRQTRGIYVSPGKYQMQ